MLILLLACASSFECGTIGRGDDPTCCVPSMWNLAERPVASCGLYQTARVERIGADDWLVCDCPGNPVEVRP